jgi:hypothetical protein
VSLPNVPTTVSAPATSGSGAATAGMTGVTGSSTSGAAATSPRTAPDDKSGKISNHKGRK